MSNEEKSKAGREVQPKDQTKSQASGSIPWRRPPANLNPIRRLFESPQRTIGPYVKNGQVVADLGCGSGYYTSTLAESVSPEGKVYAVDLDKKCIQALKEKADKSGHHNIEAHASSAADLSCIEDKSVDFVWANTLL